MTSFAKGIPDGSITENKLASKAAHTTGTYTGDGNATQAITGLGFQPVFVLIMEAANEAEVAWRTDQEGADACWIMKSDTTNGANFVDDHIKSLDSDGFTVGDGTGAGGNLMNENSTVYTFVAWK